MNQALRILTLLAVLQGTPAVALENIPPSPSISRSEIKTPNMNQPVEAREKKKYWRYFYFHKQGLDFPTSLDDIVECEKYAQFSFAGAGYMPGFIPHGIEQPESKNYLKKTKTIAETQYRYNVVVGLLGLAFGSKEHWRAMNVNRRECMKFKGYKRYGISKKLWKEITKDGREQELLIRASLAAGEKPNRESITP